ncbi:molecular chaperone TorD [Shewanella sp. JBTF-M18]|uniref:Molecular chaperone TorD n=1 Tax=Shewanella insulae TaxID=2681496 RepID=A0A6L7I220_9GAMM|nr:molecular chaperone TorD family protein [Shewanella insulae]MXR69351.1 molecular chaperone TorD [Shewanella insulae]
MTNEQLLDMQAIANVLHSVLTLYPETTLMETFKEQGIAEIWPRLSGTDAEQVGLTEIKAYLDAWNDDEQTIIRLKLDYGNLFYGPGTPIAPPWGSAYLSPSLLLNDASTIRLQQFYRDNNINLTIASNEPVDHIGLIIAVLAFLLGQLSEKPNETLTRKLINTLLAEHLLPWADRCLLLAYEHADTSYFKGFSTLARDFLNYLSVAFDIEPKKLAIYR